MQRGAGDVRAARTRRCLDELDERPADVPLVVVLGAALGTLDGRVVSAQAVVEHAVGVVGQGENPSLAPGCRAFEAGVDELCRVAVDAAPATQHEPRVYERRVPG